MTGDGIRGSASSSTSSISVAASPTRPRAGQEAATPRSSTAGATAGILSAAPKRGAAPSRQSLSVKPKGRDATQFKGLSSTQGPREPSATGAPLINELPPEIRLHLMRFLAPVDRRAAGQVCTEWRSLANDDSFLGGLFEGADNPGAVCETLKKDGKTIAEISSISAMWGALFRGLADPYFVADMRDRGKSALEIRRIARLLKKPVENRTSSDLFHTGVITCDHVYFCENMAYEQDLWAFAEMRSDDGIKAIARGFFKAEWCIEHSFDSILGNTGLVLNKNRIFFNLGVEQLKALGKKLERAGWNITDALALGLARRNMESTVLALIDLGAKVDATAPRSGTTALHDAASGHPDLVEILIKNKADINAKDVSGSTALHFASSHSARLLIEAGADINSQNKRGETPLHYGGSEKTKLLVAAGAKVDVPDNRGKTPLHNIPEWRMRYDASDKEGMEQQAIALIENGADIYAVDHAGHRPVCVTKAHPLWHPDLFALVQKLEQQAFEQGKTATPPRAQSNVPKPIAQIARYMFG